jgi:rubrerythrin
MNRPVKDVSREELIKMMDQLIKGGNEVFVKWTCPKCGDRCIANEKNTFNVSGYIHETRENGERCDTHYNGDQWGLMAIMIFG